MRFQIATFLILICVITATGCSENDSLQTRSGKIAFVNADTVQFKRGGTLEWLLVDQCLKNKVTLEMLQNFLATGGDVNAFVYHSHEETHEHQTSNIPILEAFEPTGEYTIKTTYRINVFQALMRQDPENKMEMCVYLLKNGADPNIKSPDGMNAAEYLLIEQEKWSDWLRNGVEDDFFEPTEFTLGFRYNFIDTLMAYGLKANEVNLKYAGAGYDLMIRYLRYGADPKTIDVTLFVTELWTGSIYFEEFKAYHVDFSQLKGEEFMEDLFSGHSLEILLNYFGFDPNTKVSDGYLLHWAIVEDRFYCVKLLVEKGGTKINEAKNPYLFALEQGASPEILEFLGQKFGSNP